MVWKWKHVCGDLDSFLIGSFFTAVYPVVLTGALSWEWSFFRNEWVEFMVVWSFPNSGKTELENTERENLCQPERFALHNFSINLKCFELWAT